MYKPPTKLKSITAFKTKLRCCISDVQSIMNIRAAVAKL